MKKLGTLVITFCLIVTLQSGVQAATDFASNESYYLSLCSEIGLTDSELATCNEFNVYLEKKQEQLQKDIKTNDSNLKNIKNDLLAIAAEMDRIKKQIADKEKEIAYIETRITNLQNSIDSKNTIVKERMYVMQSYTNSNGFLEFLVGAKDFDDLFSRIESVNDITAYDKEVITELIEQKKEVEAEKIRVEESKKTLDALETQQTAYLEAAKAKEAEFREVAEQLEADSDEMKAQRSAVGKAIEEALARSGGSLTPATSAGWGKLLAAGKVTAAGWVYPTGGRHLGMDVGANVGTNIYAPANGVMITQYFGCPTYGKGITDTCGGYKGNYVMMAVTISGKTYGVLVQHLQQTKILNPTSDNPFVPLTQGMVVGKVGHSGSSTGPHLHVEIFDLSHLTIEQAIQLYSRTGNDFGLGYGTAGYNTRCEVRSSPCRINPSYLYGYSLGQVI